MPRPARLGRRTCCDVSPIACSAAQAIGIQDDTYAPRRICSRTLEVMDDVGFDEFMTRRAVAADAYVSGNPKPLGEIVARESPATFFGPKGDAVRGAEEVWTRYESDAAAFGPDSENRLEIIDHGMNADIAYWVGFQRSTA